MQPTFGFKTNEKIVDKTVDTGINLATSGLVAEIINSRVTPEMEEYVDQLILRPR